MKSIKNNYIKHFFAKLQLKNEDEGKAELAKRFTPLKEKTYIKSRKK